MENLKAEFFIPLIVNKLINDKTATVKVLDTTSKWFGVTYSADRQAVVDKIQSLVDEGVYPNKLFKTEYCHKQRRLAAFQYVAVQGSRCYARA